MKKAKTKPPPNWEDTRRSFEQFERLAKNLMAVPKKELDRELAKSHKNAAKRKADK